MGQQVGQSWKTQRPGTTPSMSFPHQIIPLLTLLQGISHKMGHDSGPLQGQLGSYQGRTEG